MTKVFSGRNIYKNKKNNEKSKSKENLNKEIIESPSWFLGIEMQPETQK